MSTEQIQTVRAQLTTIISEAQLLLRQLQVECPHVNKTGVYKGNTGNWCSQDDSYWIDAKCPDCGKSWMIDSEMEQYRTFDGVILRDA